MSPLFQKAPSGCHSATWEGRFEQTFLFTQDLTPSACQPFIRWWGWGWGVRPPFVRWWWWWAWGGGCCFTFIQLLDCWLYSNEGCHPFFEFFEMLNNYYYFWPSPVQCKSNQILSQWKKVARRELNGRRLQEVSTLFKWNTWYQTKLFFRKILSKREIRAFILFSTSCFTSN